jgi:S-DNA-T family DNA segregation ATPase FtsK/SpoIIIE
MLDTVVQKLRARGQPVRPAGFELGPTFARLKVEPKDDTDFAKVKKQADNLKLHLALEQKPLIANQAGFISIDIQRSDRQTVPLLPLLAGRPPRLNGQPAFVGGVDVAGRPHWLNLADHDTCHLLIAGTTGSGKSEFLKGMIAGLTNHLSPTALQLFLIDPKQVTFNLSGPSLYLASPVVYDAGEAIPILERCCDEMERRYTLLRKHSKESIDALDAANAVPRWVVVFDEFADLMADRSAKSELEASLKRLGAKARAAGIHLVLGTQRPEASVVTPLLRSNLPGRISLRVISEKDSKLVLPDQPDAAYLLGKGDLFWWFRGGLVRLQSPFVTRPDLERSLRIGG